MTNNPDAAGMEITATGDIPAVEPAPHRAAALDIVRGLAILLMVFSSCIPNDKPLPSWLFHAQEPTTFDSNRNVVHVFDPTHAGLTFVDLVFPLFLFCLGAAIPLALSKKLDRGTTRRRLTLDAAIRLIQLSWFAVYSGNIRPVALHDHPNASTWLIALLGYALMYPMFTRLPQTWTSRQKFGARIAGYGGGVLLLALLTGIHYYPHRLGFELARVDVIIVVMGDMALFGAAIWVFTRGSSVQRLGAMAVLLAIRLGSSQPGWLQDIWTFAPKNTGFLFAFDYLKYLFVVIPGTMAGDMIHEWIAAGDTWVDGSNRRSMFGVVGLTFLLVIGVLAGYESRKLALTAAFCFAVCLVVNVLLSRPKDSAQRLARRLVLWGSYWLLTGVLVQPFEGGIKKDPSTLSYYFITTGLAFFVIACFLILTGSLKLRKPFQLLADCGQNPMIAYVSMANFILPVLGVLHLLGPLNRLFANRWMSVALAGLETVLLAFLVGQLTHRKIFWRT